MMLPWTAVIRFTRCRGLLLCWWCFWLWWSGFPLLSLCFFACLRSFTDKCIAHRQQFREQRKHWHAWCIWPSEHETVSWACPLASHRWRTCDPCGTEGSALCEALPSTTSWASWRVRGCGQCICSTATVCFRCLIAGVLAFTVLRIDRPFSAIVGSARPNLGPFYLDMPLVITSFWSANLSKLTLEPRYSDVSLSCWQKVSDFLILFMKRCTQESFKKFQNLIRESKILLRVSSFLEPVSISFSCETKWKRNP